MTKITFDQRQLLQIALIGAQTTQVKIIRAKVDGTAPLGTRRAGGMKNPSDAVIELARECNGSRA
jgi:hypothetical protein